MNAQSWYNQMGAVTMAPAKAETFKDKVSGDVRLMLTKDVSASGFLALRSAMAWKYGRCRMSSSS